MHGGSTRQHSPTAQRSSSSELELVGSSESRRRAHGRGALPIAARGPNSWPVVAEPNSAPPQKPKERSMRSLLTAATLVLGLAVSAQARYTPRDTGRESPLTGGLGANKPAQVQDCTGMWKRADLGNKGIL